MSKLILAIGAVLATSLLKITPIYATDKRTDFDNGVSASAAVESARESARDTKEAPVAYRAATMPSAAPISARVTVSIRGHRQPFGSVFGPFQPRVLQSQPYLNALDLFDSIKVLPAQVQQPLNEEWQSIDNVRTDLFIQAEKLDSDDSALYNDGQAIDRETTTLKSRQAAFNQDVANYNRQCAGQPVNQFCSNWYAQIQRTGSQLSNDIANHNAAVDSWNSRYLSLSTSATDFSNKVSAWEDTINIFISHATKAIEDGGVTRVRVQAQTGSTVIKSYSVAKVGPVSLPEGYQLLGEVYDNLPQSERDNRVNAFAGAKDFMARCSQSGGCRAPVEKPIHNDSSQIPWGPRIDITVFSGTAFVDTPALKRP